MTGSRSGAGNPAARVFTCANCGRPADAAARGPLPRLCDDCKADPGELRYRIATARNLALEANRADVAVELDRAGELLTPSWSRFGE